MLKFLLISNMYPTLKSPGYGSFVRNVCDGLGRHGVNVCRKCVIKGRCKNSWIKLAKYLAFYVSIFLGFWKRYDFIYIHFPNQAIPLMRWLYRIRQPKIFVNYHGEDLIYNDSGYGNRLGVMTEDFCRKYATAIVVPSEYFKAIVVKRGIVDGRKVIVSPSGGIDPSVFYPSGQAVNIATVHLGYVGRIEPDKGIIEYLATCKRLKDLCVDFSGTVIGYGSYYPSMLDFIASNGLGESIKVINGVPQKELGDYYRLFNLLIFSSSRTGESLGLTGIEAMACGVPVIGSNIGGIASYVVDGINGWLTELGDVDGIVSRVLQYKDMSEDKKAEMKRQCLQTASLYYRETVCLKLSEDIKKALSECTC